MGKDKVINDTRDPQIQLHGAWRKVYDHQKGDDFDLRKSATIIIYEGDAMTNFDSKIYSDFLYMAIVMNEHTSEIQSKIFFGEMSHNDSVRWAHDTANNFLYK
jgi:hypothetical protein